MDERDYVEAYEREYPTLTQRLEEFLRSDEFRDTFMRVVREVAEMELKQREAELWRWRNPERIGPLPQRPWPVPPPPSSPHWWSPPPIPLKITC